LLPSSSPLPGLLAFEFDGFVELGGVYEILWTCGGEFRGKQMLRAREMGLDAPDQASAPQSAGDRCQGTRWTSMEVRSTA
jgi:hypothetical protein